MPSHPSAMARTPQRIRFDSGRARSVSAMGYLGEKRGVMSAREVSLRKNLRDRNRSPFLARDHHRYVVTRFVDRFLSIPRFLPALRLRVHFDAFVNEVDDPVVGNAGCGVQFEFR